MPRLSYFYGIAIYFYWDDHNPPHYHAVYGGMALIVITGASVLHGSLPARALLLVWHRPHQHELEATWELAKRNQATGTIQGLP